MKSFSTRSNYETLDERDSSSRSRGIRRQTASYSGRLCITLSIVALGLITLFRLWFSDRNLTVMQDGFTFEESNTINLEKQLSKYDNSSELLLVNVLFRHGDSEYIEIILKFI